MGLRSAFFFTGLVLFMAGWALVYYELAPAKLLQCDIQSFTRGLLGAATAMAGWFIVRRSIERTANVPIQND